MSIGFIYILSNASMPGLLKIGFTESVVEQRLQQLRGTGVPTDFEIVASVRVSDPKKCEQLIHTALSKFREASNREFFRMSAREALPQIVGLLAEHIHSDGSATLSNDLTPFGDIDSLDQAILKMFLHREDHIVDDWARIADALELDPLETEYRLDQLVEKGYLREIRQSMGGVIWNIHKKGRAFAMWLRKQEHRR